MPVSEVDKMSIEEFNGWFEYFSIIHNRDNKNTDSSSGSSNEALTSFFRKKG